MFCCAIIKVKWNLAENVEQTLQQKSSETIRQSPNPTTVAKCISSSTSSRIRTWQPSFVSLALTRSSDVNLSRLGSRSMEENGKLGPFSGKKKRKSIIWNCWARSYQQICNFFSPFIIFSRGKSEKIDLFEVALKLSTFIEETKYSIAQSFKVLLQALEKSLFVSFRRPMSSRISVI